MPGTPEYYLDKLKKIQKQIHCTTAPIFADSLALKKIILIWLVLASSIGTLLEYTHNLLPKVSEGFSQKNAFHGGKTIWANLLGVVLHGENNGYIIQKRESFTKHFSVT